MRANCGGDTEGVGDQAGRRRGQPSGQPHLLDMVVERLLQPGQQIGELGAVGVGRVVSGAEVDFTLGHRLQRLALEFRHRLHPHLVDGVGEQQHFVAFGLERLQVRRTLQQPARFARRIEDLLLAVPHPAHVVGQRRRGVRTEG